MSVLRDVNTKFWIDQISFNVYSKMITDVMLLCILHHNNLIYESHKQQFSICNIILTLLAYISSRVYVSVQVVKLTTLNSLFKKSPG